MTTPIPHADKLFEHWDSATLGADGTDVTNWVGSIAGLTTSVFGSIAPKVRVIKGAKGLRCNYAGKPSGQVIGLRIGRPTSLIEAISAPLLCAINVVVRVRASEAPGGGVDDFATAFGSNPNTGITLGINSGHAVASTTRWPFQAVDDEIYVVSWIGEKTPAHYPTGSGSFRFVGRNYIQGTAFGDFPYSVQFDTDDFVIGANNYGGGLGYEFYGDVLDVFIHSWTDDKADGWTAADGLQLVKHVKEKYGQPYPWAGQKRFVTFNGDSQTEVGPVEWPRQLAELKGLKVGQWNTVGKSGWVVASTLAPFPGEPSNITDYAPMEVDGYKAVTGLAVLHNWHEWHNRGTGAEALDIPAVQVRLDQDIAYNQARRTADPSCRIIQGTSFSSYGRDGAGRDYYDNYVVNNKTTQLIDLAVPIHTLPHIGANGSSQAADAADYYTDTGAGAIHVNQAGNALIAGMWSDYYDEAMSWPTKVSILAPATVPLGSGPVTIVLQLDGVAERDTTIAISNTGASGTFSATSFVIEEGDSSATLTFTPTAPGAVVFTTTNDNNLFNIDATLAVLHLVLTVPDVLLHYVPSNLSVAINTGLANPVDITFLDGGAGGVFSPGTVTVAPGHLSADFTYKAIQTGPILVTANAAGYQPAAAALAVVEPAPIDGDGTLATWPPDLTATVSTDPDGAALLPFPFDPGDRARIKVDMTARCFGRTVASIEAVGFDAASAALGWRIGVADDRPILDRTNHAAAIHVECDPAFQQNAAFAGSGVVVTPTIRVSFTNGEAMECSFPFQARQL